MKKIIITIIIFVLFHNHLFGESIRKKVKEGNELYYEEKYNEALNKYQNAIIDDPQSPEIHFNLGNSHYKIKKYDESLKEYEKLLSVPDIMFQSKVYYNIGNTLFRSGKIAESILSYKKALELNPNDIDAKFNLEFARNFLKEHSKKEPMPQQNQQGMNQQKNEQQGEGDKGKKDSEDKKSESDSEKEKKEKEMNGSQQKGDEKKEMSKEEAERILKALESDEKKDLKDARKMKIPDNIRVLKDW
jgi:tetratricopeptide (TPR) repeat protein